MAVNVLIIGGGFAGLAAGSYLARSGVETLILEQHSKPGGLCTGWSRKGYTMDYCVHWLIGTDGESEFRRMWDELGAFDNPDGSRTGIVNPAYFTRIGLQDGDSVCLYSNINRLEGELNRIAPEDREVTKDFCRGLRSLSRLDAIVLDERHGRLGRFRHHLKHASSSITMMRHATTTVGSLSRRCRTPRLAEMLLAGIPGDWSLIALSMGLAMQHAGRAGYPVGGSIALSGNIEAMYRRLGGRIRHNERVESIIVENGRAAGVRLADGGEVRAGYVVSAADGRQTLFGMLPGIGLPRPLKDAYAKYPLFPSSIFIGLGVNADLSHLPHASMPYLDQPLTLPDGDSHHRFNVSVYNHDPTLAPEGRTFVAVLINTWKGPYWIDLRRKNPQEYAREKARIGAFVVDALERNFGRIREAVDVLDVSTPATVFRYTGNWKGSYEGFAPTPQTLTKSLPRTIPGLGRFRMAGQWTSPGGGLPTAAQEGRNAALAICREFGITFRARP